MKTQKPVLPDELKPVSISFKSAFWIVVVGHLAVILGVCASPLITAAKANDDKKLLEEPVYVGVSEPTQVASPTPTPAPTPVATPMPSPSNNSDWPRTSSKPVVTRSSSLTKEYVVKQGDTFYGIVKKYKLNFVKLQEINNIKDPSKIKVGQHLKFTK